MTSVLLPANLNEATSISLTYEGKKFELEKKGTDWFLTKPIKDRADNDKVSVLMRSWNDAKAVEFIDAKPLNPAAYNLDKPRLSAMAYIPGKKGGQTLTFLAGKDHDPSTFYAMQQGGKYAFIVNNTELNKLEPPLEDLRSKLLFKMNRDEVGRITYHVRGNVVDLVLDSAKRWHFADDKQAKVDGFKVTQNMTDLTNVKAVRFFDKKPADPSLTGLDDPYLRLRLVSKDGKTTETLITGKNSKDNFVYARMVETGLTVGIDWQVPGKFFLTRDDLVDKTLFDFDKEAVKKVQIKEKDKTLTLSKEKSGGWTASASGSNRKSQVQADQMTTLIYTTAGLKYHAGWTRFIPMT